MLIRHLKFFVTLAEEEHFGRAAELCHVTQPTLSIAIRKLEEDLETALIQRGHRFMGLTSEGEKVLHWGRQILANYDSLLDELNTEHQGQTGTLRLGVIPTAMLSVAFISEIFQIENPMAKIEIRSMTSKTIKQALDNYDIDAGISYLNKEESDNLNSIPIYIEKYVFACNDKHIPSKKNKIPWQEIIKQPLCLLTDDMQHRQILNDIAKKAGVHLTPGIVSNSFLGVISHLRSGKWCAIVPHTFALVLQESDKIALHEMIAPTPQQQIGLILSARTPHPPMTRALLACSEKYNLEHQFQQWLSSRHIN